MTGPDGKGVPSTPLITYGLVAVLAGFVGFGAGYAIKQGADNSDRKSVV